MCGHVRSLSREQVRPRIVSTLRTLAESGKAAEFLTSALALYEACPTIGKVHLIRYGRTNHIGNTLPFASGLRFDAPS